MMCAFVEKYSISYKKYIYLTNDYRKYRIN